MASYEVIVVGAGGMGSATLATLAARGVKVLGIDRFAPPHDRGSTHGRTRIIRQAYMEHPDYVPLVQRSFELWQQLQERVGRPLLELTGLLQLGPAQGHVVRGVLASALRWQLPVEEVSAAELPRRFAGFRCHEQHAGVYEARAGCLRVEACVQAHLDEARRLGAELLLNSVVHGWQVDGGGVAVTTEAGTFRAGRLILAAGAWATQVLADLRLPLQVRRQGQFWFPASSRYTAQAGCPCFLYETDTGVFYGLPALDDQQTKVAEHTGGTPIDDPLTLSHTVNEAELARVRGFTQAWLPELSQQMAHHAACMYTLTPDEHFIVDRHPQHEQVVFIAGLSGHGFKFAPVLGEALSDLATRGHTSLPIEFLRVDRPALRRS